MDKCMVCDFHLIFFFLMTLLHKLIYRFPEIPTKITTVFRAKIDEFTL